MPILKRQPRLLERTILHVRQAEVTAAPRAGIIQQPKTKTKTKKQVSKRRRKMSVAEAAAKRAKPERVLQMAGCKC